MTKALESVVQQTEHLQPPVKDNSRTLGAYLIPVEIAEITMRLTDSDAPGDQSNLFYVAGRNDKEIYFALDLERAVGDVRTAIHCGRPTPLSDIANYRKISDYTSDDF